MFDESMQSQLRDYFAKLTRSVVLRYTAPTADETRPGADARRELSEMVRALEAVSDQIIAEAVETVEGTESDEAVLDVLGPGEAPRVRFRGVPGGHEFSSLVLAILQAGGVPPRLDEGVLRFVASISRELTFQTVVSLDCHNCPEVVQMLNAFALRNPRIRHEMIDGALYPEFVKKHNIQSVPAALLDGQVFSVGKLDAAAFIEKLRSAVAADAAESAEVERCDIAIIGGGPAGVTAAVYEARKGLSVTIVADRVGGQLRDTLAIENVIALKHTTGTELSGELSERLRENGVRVREMVTVKSIEPGQPHRLVLSSGGTIEARAVIIATGAKWRELGVPGEKENIGSGVAFCPHCDGPFFKGRDVAVIGGGNSGVEAALDLAGIVKSVVVLEFADSYRADSVLLDRLRRMPNARMLASVETKEVLSEKGSVTGLRFVDRKTGAEERLDVDGIFVQIGLVPNSGFVRDLLEVTKHGEIVVNERGGTSVPGIFACGDVATTPYKQILTAMGSGATAALAAFEYTLKLPQDSAPAAQPAA